MRMGGERKAPCVVLIPLCNSRQINDIAAEATSRAHCASNGTCGLIRINVFVTTAAKSA
jgi:hypothetical protein